MRLPRGSCSASPNFVIQITAQAYDIDRPLENSRLSRVRVGPVSRSIFLKKSEAPIGPTHLAYRPEKSVNRPEIAISDFCSPWATRS